VLGLHEHDIEARLRSRTTTGQAWRGFEALRRDLAAQDAAAGADVEKGAAEGAEKKAAKGAPRRERIELVRPTQRVLELGLRTGSTRAISQVLSLRDVTHETEVDRMKSEFLSTAAHELRTPMTSIFGFSELMMRRKLKPEQQEEVLATIHRQTALMISIVNELLDLARIEARRGKDFELQRLDLGELAAEVMHDFKPPQERAPPLLLAAAGVAPVRVDRNKLAQAFGNVLSNAYKYSPEGGDVSVHLVQAGCGHERQVGLQVRDAGIGMTPEQLARLGERFYRADASGTIPGTGLGVSIVKEIIELLGGRLAVASRAGQGTQVTLWLPLAENAEAAAVELEMA
jgi:signal transduction histidine kinase